MAKKYLLSERDNKEIISFLKDYLPDVSAEENKSFMDTLTLINFINECENDERELQGYYCYINYLQGIVWKDGNERWVFAAISERALRDLIRMVPENEKINCIFEKRYKGVMEEYFTILSINDENTSIIGGKGKKDNPYILG